ncbi:hypothetical protein N6H14_07590 [Paenibacillus sp. CC-CFT747]|nr:hypothetical protein N6H14_07590 [Paenibacillus sp. CC-CFT747]
MSLLIGVLIGIVLIQLLNLYKKKADAKKKVEGSSSNERKPIEPYRWTPDGNAADAPSDFQLSGNAGVLNEEERTALEAAEADEWPDKEARTAEEPAAAPAQAESLPQGERIDFNRASEVLGSVGEIRSMAEAGMILQRISGQAPLPYSTIDFGRRRYPQCISIIIEETDALRLVYMLQPLLTNELLAFVGTNQWLGEEKHAGAELVVGRGDPVRYRPAGSDRCRQLRQQHGGYHYGAEIHRCPLRDFDQGGFFRFGRLRSAEPAERSPYLL